MGDGHTHICKVCDMESDPNDCIDTLAECYYPKLTLCAQCEWQEKEER